MKNNLVLQFECIDGNILLETVYSYLTRKLNNSLRLIYHADSRRVLIIRTHYIIYKTIYSTIKFFFLVFALMGLNDFPNLAEFTIQCHLCNLYQ